MSEVAVVLMAYGSPDRLEDVPAYYADIRGGRPIAPELLDDLVARYRALGIEDSNPLNEITERTRAALEAELGIPVFTGMRHWQPRIAEAAERGARAGARTIVGLVLAPHYRRCRSAATGACSRRPSAAAPSSASSSAGDDEPGFVELLGRARARDATRTSSSPRTRCPRGSSRRATRTATSCSRPRGSSPRPPASRSWSFSFQSESPTGEPWLGPDILDHLDGAPGQGVRDVLVCPVGFVADHLEIRWDIDTEAAGEGPRARAPCGGSRCRTPTRRSSAVLETLVERHVPALR